MSQLGEYEEPACYTCRYWVNHDRPTDTAIKGECTNQVVIEQIQVVDEEGYEAELIPAVFTSFDWSCKGWEQRPPAGDEAQSCPA